MKKVLGLDLGTSSIGWAVVNEAENQEEKSSIVKIGVRVNPLTVDEQIDFEKGKSITTNAARTLKRSMRRNLQRYKLRRESLIKVLKEHKIITDDTVLAEEGNRTTFETYRLRAKAATQQISLEEFARVLLMINKKRGYKSSRKADSTDEGRLIDGMEVAKQLYDCNLTPGQYALSLLSQGKKYIPDFYRSDLQAEFDRVWEKQRQFYPEILTDTLKANLQNKNEKQTWETCQVPFGIIGIKRSVTGDELKRQNYQWRAKAVVEQVDFEELAIVLQKINGQLKNSSGYLGAISDRSKSLYFNKQTVGQYQMSQLDKNPNYSLRNEVFYRQDYLDEFERLWQTQSEFYAVLTPELKHIIRDIVIFYQRRLKSQKGLVNICELERREIEVIEEGHKKIKTIGPRVCPRSSLVFQEFKIWQTLNNITVSDKDNDKASRSLHQEEKELLFDELCVKDRLSKAEALKILFKNHNELNLNFKSIDGNKTQAQLFKAYQEIIFLSGNGEFDFSKMSATRIIETTTKIFESQGWNSAVLHFDSSLPHDALIQQPIYRLWHLLYSFEGDNSKVGNERLIDKISELCGFSRVYASILANVVFLSDYGNLSTKAMVKILPFMKEGIEYSVACEYAGYNHSKRSLSKEELEQKEYKDKLDILPRNTLHNPVVEKIINQMINVVNMVIETYGKPDEIRIELARELKKSKPEREQLTKDISNATKLHEKYKDILQRDFGIANVSRNDIIRYKLYLELQENSFKTLYSNTYIPKEKLFSKEFDIEHIIPQAKLFDDSFSNKTIETRMVNIEKSNATAYDYVANKYHSEGLDEYKARVNDLYAKGAISTTKRKNLLIDEANIPSGFINRDLRDSQYIAKKSRELLESIVKFVVPTTGAITDRLREDWQLVNVMKELNWNKYV